ncbi:MAG: hypothetical protein N2652_04300 [Kiritimatiellae bacterium]|nr:hypothetical protein [Kiritimatiellia bacterium]
MSRSNVWLATALVTLLIGSLPTAAREHARGPERRREPDRRELAGRPAMPPWMNPEWRRRAMERLRAAPPERRREMIRRFLQMRARRFGGPIRGPGYGMRPGGPPMGAGMWRRPYWGPPSGQVGGIRGNAPRWRGLGGRRYGPQPECRGPCPRCPCRSARDQARGEPPRRRPQPPPPPAAGAPRPDQPPAPPVAEELARRQREMEQRIEAQRRELEKAREELRRREQELREQAERLHRELRERAGGERREAERGREGRRPQA